MTPLDRLERRYGRFYIPNLMLWVAGGQIVVWLIMMLFDARIYFLMSLTRSGLMRGQVWRLVSFIFLPPYTTSPLSVALNVYFDWFVGTALERQWGSFRFNVFYLAGMLGAVAAALLTGSAGNTALNLSLFFAFAMLYPELQLLLFFVLPIKVKWLGWLSGALYAWQLLVSPLSGKASLLLCMAGFLLFFGRDLWYAARDAVVNYRRRQQWKKQLKDRWKR